MTIYFHKYQGAGNDFIIIDDRKALLFHQKETVEINRLVSHLCDRRLGIGADGLIVLRNSEEGDFDMLYFNSDGYEGTMCGNGGRCIVAFAKELGIINSQTVFSAIDGLHKADIVSHGESYYTVNLQMKDVVGVTKKAGGYFLDTGSPHLIVFTDNLENKDVYTEGKTLRYHPDFADEGTNVNFCRVIQDKVYIRTYERGVEDETLACGTGITAAAIVSHFTGQMCTHKEYPVKAKGGDLKVRFSAEKNNVYTNIFLEGPAQKVFEGVVKF